MPSSREPSRRRRSIRREELLRIIDESSVGCAVSTREKLRAVALRTDAVAVGWFHCDGVTCPARQARRRNQRFQGAFDRAMSARFKRHIDDPFVVVVTDA